MFLTGSGRYRIHFLPSRAFLVIENSAPCIAVTSTAVPLSRPRRAFRFLRRLGPAGLLAVAVSVLPGIGALVIYGRLGVIAPWLRSHPLVGPALCAGGFALAGGVALVPTYALSTLCGWSFGFPVGLTASLGGFLAAALVGYVLARAADGGRVMALVSESPTWQAVHAAVTAGGFAKVLLVVSLVRLAPIAPFSLTNVTMAAIRVPPFAYGVGTVLGMAPRTAILVFVASRLTNVDAPLDQEPWLLAAGAALTIAVMAMLGWIGKKGLTRVTASEGAGA